MSVSWQLTSHVRYALYNTLEETCGGTVKIHDIGQNFQPDQVWKFVSWVNKKANRVLTSGYESLTHYFLHNVYTKLINFSVLSLLCIICILLVCFAKNEFDRQCFIIHVRQLCESEIVAWVFAFNF